MPREPGYDPACELGPTSATKPGERRSGALVPDPIHPSIIDMLVEAYGPMRAVAEAFRLGQGVGHGRMSALLGCKACRKRSVAAVVQTRICLACGAHET